MKKEKKDKKLKQKKPRDVNKTLTRLAVLTTIVLAIVVSFFVISDNINDLKKEFENNINTINKLNDEFDVNTILTNPLSNFDFESLQNKCDESGWDLFKDGAINSTKYNNLNSAESALQLTQNETGVLLNSVLNISGNSAGVKFLQLIISKDENSSRVTFDFVYSFSFKTVLSIDSETENLLSELKITMPNTVYAISSAVYDVNTKNIVTASIAYNNLNGEDSKQITGILNGGKENKEEYIEYYATRLLLTMNNELNKKTSTVTEFVNGGINHVK